MNEACAHRIPDALEDAVAAPLLCAGIVGHRSLKRVSLPPDGRLGICGFGASGHIVAQVAAAQGAVVHVVARAAPMRVPWLCAWGPRPLRNPRAA